MEVKKVSVVEMLKKVKEKKEAEHVANSLARIVHCIDNNYTYVLESEIKTLCDYIRKNNISGAFKRCRKEAIDDCTDSQKFIESLEQKDATKSIIDCISKIKDNSLSFKNTKLIIISLFITCSLFDIEFKDL